MPKPNNTQIVKQVLQAVEWSGYTSGPPSNMGARDGYPFPSCPLCRGIRPESPWQGSFYETAIGHRPSCKLDALLTEMKDA